MGGTLPRQTQMWEPNKHKQTARNNAPANAPYNSNACFFDLLSPNRSKELHKFSPIILQSVRGWFYQLSQHSLALKKTALRSLSAKVEGQVPLGQLPHTTFAWFQFSEASKIFKISFLGPWSLQHNCWRQFVNYDDWCQCVFVEALKLPPAL